MVLKVDQLERKMLPNASWGDLNLSVRSNWSQTFLGTDVTDVGPEFLNVTLSRHATKSGDCYA